VKSIRALAIVHGQIVEPAVARQAGRPRGRRRRMAGSLAYSPLRTDARSAMIGA
jgi:hypothetical protein